MSKVDSDYEFDVEVDEKIDYKSISADKLVMDEIDRSLLNKDVIGIIEGYLTYWIDNDLFNVNMECDCVVNKPSDEGKKIDIIDPCVSEVVFVHEFTHGDVETTRKVRIDNKDNKTITYYQIRIALFSYYKEWCSIFEKVVGLPYEGYVQNANEQIIPQFEYATMKKTTMIIPITISGMYGLNVETEYDE